MRKALAVMSLLLLVGLMGCTQSTSTSTTPPVPVNTCATSVGSMVYQSVTADNLALASIGVYGLGAAGIVNKAPTYSAGWWSTSETISISTMTMAYTYNVKITDVGGNLIDTAAKLDALLLANVDRVETYTTVTITSITGTTTSFTISLGASKDNPLIFTGVGSNSISAKSISGPVSYSGSDSDGTSYAVSMTYSSVTLSASGYPSGTITFSISSGGSEIVAGSFVGDGDATATLTFTSGYSGSYTVNLAANPPTVTPASL